MAHPYHHALSSVKKWGGVAEDYIEVHSFFDQSKQNMADFRHRAMLHHTAGIYMAERHFGPTISLSTCANCGQPRSLHQMRAACADFSAKQIPTRWVGEQHVREDLGCIPTLKDWLLKITPESWMNRSRKLSLELEQPPEERVVAIREDGSYRVEPDEEPADWRERLGT